MPGKKGVKSRGIRITPIGLNILRQIKRGTYKFAKRRGGRFAKPAGRRRGAR